jgi:hypothetical protein
MHTRTILEKLHDIDDAPWFDLKGKPLDERGLAFRLRKYEIKPGDVRIGEVVRKRYRAEDLYDTWSRYVPDLVADKEDRDRDSSKRFPSEGVGNTSQSMPPGGSATSATSATNGQPPNGPCPLCDRPLVRPSQSCSMRQYHGDAAS